MSVVDLKEKLALIQDQWNPRIVGELNGQYVKLVKFQGEFPWHSHENEDELFLAVEGEFDLDFRDRTERVRPGQFVIVPKGVEHRPKCDVEASVLLFEPASTLNTGELDSHPMTRKVLERI